MRPAALKTFTTWVRGDGAARRIGLSAAAGWSNLALMAASQTLLVPLYLSRWSPEEYGVWLAAQTLGLLVTAFDRGLHAYVGNEAMRMGSVARTHQRRLLGSAMIVWITTSVLELTLVGGAYAFADRWGQGWFGTRHLEVARGGAVVLLAWTVVWCAAAQPATVVARLAVAHGRYLQFAWWHVWFFVGSTVLPAAGVTVGAGLHEAGLLYGLGTLLSYGSALAYWARWACIERLLPVQPSVKDVFSVFRGAALTTVRQAGDWLRLDGFRVLLAPTLGASGLAAFSLMRTMSNVALMGTATFLNPIAPELARGVQANDSRRFQVIFASMWGLLAVIALVLVGLQWCAPWLFGLWTHGSIPYDPWLLALFSVAVLAWLAGQPASLTLQVVNWLRPQVGTALLGTVVLVGGIYLLVPRAGSRAAAFVLLAAEIMTSVLYSWWARAWMRQRGWRWPTELERLSLITVLAASAAIVGIAGAGMWAIVLGAVLMTAVAWQLRLTLPIF